MRALLSARGPSVLIALTVALSAVTSAQSVTHLPPQAPAGRVALDASLGGIITRQSDGAAIAQARVTLFRPNLSFFRETRTASDGSYAFTYVPAGSFMLGVAALGQEYVESVVVLASGPNSRSFTLQPETNGGTWNVIGDTSPEVFDATDIGVLRVDGRIMYCHDTVSPVLFDPVTGNKTFPPGSWSEQGCMNGTQLADGSTIFCGGQNGADPGQFMNAVPWVKRFTLVPNFVQLPDMLLSVGRWYPGLARLADGRLLIMGGGTAPAAQRTDTCEVFNPATSSWSWTGTMNSPLEFPPCALLYTGRVLRTWGSAPELYDPATGTWSATGGFVHPNRGYPGHSDHSLVVLSDGRALAVGVSRENQPSAVMTEIYDPTSGVWSTMTSPSLVRMQCEVVQLPDGKVFVEGGDQETTAGSEPNVLGIVKRCDLFDPTTSSWRRVADTFAFREYHAVTLLVPDGRVVTTGGSRIKFQYGPTTNSIDAWSPPYLARGVRPQITNLSDASPSRGQAVRVDVFPQTQLTSVVLMGMQSTTHWVDGGIPRRIVLPVSQGAAEAEIVLPSDPNLLPLGWYLLFGMVDDIPSRALIFRVDP
jgi:hypothetical protein